MKRLIQWSIDHHWMVIGALGAAARRRALDRARHAGRRLPRSDRADGHDPDRRPRHGARGDGSRSSRFRSRARSTARRACAACARRRRVGIAVVWVEFDWGTDIFLARQVVAEKLALVGGTLPPQVERPVLAPVSSIMGEILFFAISSEHDDPLDAAHRRRHRRPPAAARRRRRLAGDADRRRRAAVPGHRPSRSAAREQRVARPSCSTPSAAPARTRRPASTPKGRRSTCCRRSAACARPRRSARAWSALRGDALGAGPRRRRRARRRRRSSAAKARAAASRRSSSASRSSRARTRSS